MTIEYANRRGQARRPAPPVFPVVTAEHGDMVVIRVTTRSDGYRTARLPLPTGTMTVAADTMAQLKAQVLAHLEAAGCPGAEVEYRAA